MSDYRKLAGNMLDKFWSPPNFQLNDEQLFMLRAIADGKLAVVPAEPTEAMLKAADKHVGADNAGRAYRAMLKAAQEKT